jgi:antitoxin PrlF
MTGFAQAWPQYAASQAGMLDQHCRGDPEPVLHSAESKDTQMESAITTKGQATIPKPVRDHLGLKPGDRVKFFFHPDGTVVLLPKLPPAAMRGMLRTQRRVTIEAMNEAIAAGASQGTVRRRRG